MNDREFVLIFDEEYRSPLHGGFAAGAVVFCDESFAADLESEQAPCHRCKAIAYIAGISEESAE